MCVDAHHFRALLDRAKVATDDTPRVSLLEEDLFDAWLCRGEHRGVVDELMDAVYANPIRERLVGQLMLALYRGGLRAEALAVIRETRARLTEELGLDPGRELRDRRHRHGGSRLLLQRSRTQHLQGTRHPAVLQHLRPALRPTLAAQ